MALRMRLPLLLILLAAPLGAQQSMPPIGSIDFYGLHNVAADAARRALGIALGDVLPDSAARAAIVARLRAIPGVQDARLVAVCCEPSGRTMLFVGIAEPGAPRPTFHAAPTGNVRLPAEVVARDSVFSLRLLDAVRAGRSAEVDSGGHEFFADSALKAIQHEYLAFTATHIPLVRDVLAHSASSDQRVLAAELLDYAPDVRTVIPDLVAAMRDPMSDVRNAAMRALWVIAAYGQKEPSTGIHVPAAPFIDLLWSLDWTDRNKSSFALSELTVSRDSTLLSELRARALRPLVDIARWSDPGHAYPGVMLLGRIEGRSDQQIVAAMQSAGRTAIIDQAEHMLRKRAEEP
jgi:hypothetical protein